MARRRSSVCVALISIRFIGILLSSIFITCPIRANDAKTDESRHEELPESWRNACQFLKLTAMHQRRRLTPAYLQGGSVFSSYQLEPQCLTDLNNNVCELLNMSEFLTVNSSQTLGIPYVCLKTSASTKLGADHSKRWLVMFVCARLGWHRPNQRGA